MESSTKDDNTVSCIVEDVAISRNNGLVNASGHVQEVDRNFGLWSICSLAIALDNAWVAEAGALVVALYNGGGPGVIFELLAACFFYCFIGACLAELASAIPSSASVYHWASITPGPKYGRICSFYAGWWNYLAWLCGSSGAVIFGANAILAMYALYHPDYNPARWHVFVIYIVILWGASSVVIFKQSYLPKLTLFGAVISLLAWLISTLVLVIMPSRTGAGYAPSRFVWGDWNNLTGWSSDGLVFLIGMLNGAWTIGTIDGATHLAEEIPRAKVNLPKAICAQMVLGTVTSFIFTLALMYSITDLEAISTTRLVSLPLAAIYQQATRSNAGTMGLLFVFLFTVLSTIPTLPIQASRTLWTLARDDAVPFSSWTGQIHPVYKCPVNATLASAVLVTAIGLIYVGSAAAFTAIIDTFVIFSTLSYLLCILPHLCSGRKHVVPGPFWMPNAAAYAVMGVACAYIVVFDVVFMFPYTMPVSVETMNYSCVLVGGCTILLSGWYLWVRRRGYVGPRVVMEARDDIIHGHVLTGEELQKDRKKEFVVTETSKKQRVGCV